MFWAHAMAYFAGRGVGVERVITDNGSCYRSEPGPRPAKRADRGERRASTGTMKLSMSRKTHVERERRDDCLDGEFQAF